MLALEELTKRFAGQSAAAVDALSLSLPRGALMVLMGPSGCGKTTTLRMIAGLERPTAGHVSWEGRDLTDVPPRRRDVAMLFQSAPLYPHLNVRGNLAFGLRLRGLGRAEVRRRVDEAAAALSIEPLLDRRAGQLSGGQRQRVALSRALLRRPKLFLLDEPLAHLDLPARFELRDEIRATQQRLEAAMLYVTHDPAEALQLGGRLAVLSGGRLLQLAEGQAVYQRPASLAVARLLSVWPLNCIRGRIDLREDGCRFWCEHQVGAAHHAENEPPPHDASAAFELPVSWRPILARAGVTHVILGVRPEQLQVAVAADECGRLAARVMSVEWRADALLASVRAFGTRLLARLPAETRLEVGQSITLAARHVHLFAADDERSLVPP